MRADSLSYLATMRLPIYIIITIILINYGDCRQISWFPEILSKLSNSTLQLTKYVRERGRSIKHYYAENWRKKITAYLGLSNRTEEPQEFAPEKLKRLKRKFNEYVITAQDMGESLFNTIAPKKLDYDCQDDDPSIHMTTPQLIALHGYPAESHTIITDDGYILTVHRIPFSKNGTTRVSPRKTVLLHHGLLGSSADWILGGPEKGLGYILSDAGYDVWLANARGNTYSRVHRTLNVESFSFWNFTFHEISQHDLPAVIDYIMEIKGWDVKIDYVGHSMGTTILFAMLSTKTRYNKILRAGYALAPVAFMTDVKSPIHLLARYSDRIEVLFKLLGANEFLPQNAVLRWLSKHACEINHWEEAICENSMFIICGHDEKQFNRTLLPLILGHVPAGASTKTLIHYAQEIKSGGHFQQFDYGPEGNSKEYGTVLPPEYPVEKITLPIALFSSENDWLASDIDVTNLYVQIVNPIEHYIVPLKEFNHIDFLWAVDAPTLVYKRLLELLIDGNNKLKEPNFEENAIIDI